MDADSRRPWIRFAAVGVLALAALLASSSAWADDPATLQSEAERLRAANDDLAARSQTALLELYALESRLDRSQARVGALHARRDRLEDEEASARRRLEVARENLTEAERRLGSRLRELYVQGEVDPLAVLLGAESLDEALTAYDNLTRLADQDRGLLRDLRDSRRELQSSLRELGRRSTELRAVIADAEAQQASLASARASRAAYVAGLADQRAFNSRQISRLSARAAAASEKTSAPEGTPAPEPQPDPPTPSPGGSRMVVDVVGYCLTGTTASGLPVGWGIVAVDPRVIPLGTKLYVPGYGDGVAADTGSAIKGRIIDVWFPSCAQARAWGRKTLTITVFW